MILPSHNLTNGLSIVRRVAESMPCLVALLADEIRWYNPVEWFYGRIYTTFKRIDICSSSLVNVDVYFASAFSAISSYCNKTTERGPLQACVGCSRSGIKLNDGSAVAEPWGIGPFPRYTPIFKSLFQNISPSMNTTISTKAGRLSVTVACISIIF